MPAITIEQLPEDCYITVSGYNNIYDVYYSDKNNKPYAKNGKSLGIVSFGLSKDRIAAKQNPQIINRLIYEVTYANVQKGYGPLLYDVAMEVVNKITNGKGYLKCDGGGVSQSVENVWNHYHNRNDIKKKPLDSEKNEVTPTKIDNAYLDSAKRAYGHKRPEQWYNKPLSTGFNKQINIINSDKVIFELDESRRTIKVNEATNVITRHIVHMVKGAMPLLNYKWHTRDLTPIILDKMSVPNKYIFNILKKHGVKNVKAVLFFSPLKTDELLSVRNASYNSKEHIISVEICYNLNGIFEKILEQMNMFVKHIRERITHELTHSEQLKSKQLKHEDSLKTMDVSSFYENVIIEYRNTYLRDFEVQAYSKGLMIHYKYPDVFYREWNELLFNSTNLCEKLVAIFRTLTGIPYNSLYFEHSVKLLIDHVLDFKQAILNYLKQHYRNVTVDPQRDLVTRERLEKFIEKKYTDKILNPAPPKATETPGKRKLEID